MEIVIMGCLPGASCAGLKSQPCTWKAIILPMHALDGTFAGKRGIGMGDRGKARKPAARDFRSVGKVLPQSGRVGCRPR